jgi:hypothetical protein
MTGGVEPTATGSRPWLWVAFALVFAIVVLAGIWFLILGPGRQGGPAGSVLVELSGNGDTTSVEFFARHGWQIQWETEAESFQLSIHGDPEIGPAIDQEGPGSGVTSPVPSGTFRLEVKSDGSWSLNVVQGD